MVQQSERMPQSHTFPDQFPIFQYTTRLTHMFWSEFLLQHTHTHNIPDGATIRSLEHMPQSPTFYFAINSQYTTSLTHVLVRFFALNQDLNTHTHTHAPHTYTHTWTYLFLAKLPRNKTLENMFTSLSDS